MKELFQKSGLSQAEIARVTKLGRSTVSEYASGKLSYSHKQLFKIAALLYMKVSVSVTESGETVSAEPMPGRTFLIEYKEGQINAAKGAVVAVGSREAMKARRAEAAEAAPNNCFLFCEAEVWGRVDKTLPPDEEE